MANTPVGAEETGGISFSGGANNEYITKFAEDPQYDRTLEEIENMPGLNYLDEETRERFRALARRRRELNESIAAQTAAGTSSVLLDGKNTDPGWRIGGRVAYVDPLEEEMSMPSAPAPVAPAGAPAPTGRGFVQPILEEDPDEALAAREAPAQPKTFLGRLISTNKGFAVYTIIAGVINLLWNVLYVVGLISRAVMFDTAERALLLQGQRSFTLTFTSPILTLLKVFMYLLPILTLVWALLFKKADAKKDSYNKKTVIVFLCLIVLAMIFAVIDLTALHLLF